MPETLYLTVNLIDRFLEAKQVTRKHLQLVGVTAMLVASKYEEIWAPEVRRWAELCVCTVGFGHDLAGALASFADLLCGFPASMLRASLLPLHLTACHPCASARRCGTLCTSLTAPTRATRSSTWRRSC